MTYKKRRNALPNPLPTVLPPGRNVVLLSICQAIGSSGISMGVLTGGIVGIALAPSPAWATLPTALMIVGIALFSIPAALIMKRIGRKRGFISAAILGAVATSGAALAIALGNFYLFGAMLLFIGGSAAFVQQFRFAAVESVAPNYAGRAISFVLVGGILAGFLGPEIGRDARDWLPYGAYTGSFVVVAILYVVAAIILAFMRDVRIKETADTRPERPLLAVITQRTYLIAVLSSAVAYGVMGFIMSATSISMHVIDQFTIRNTTLVIQGHILGMYIPSLFTGFLMERLGLKVLQVMGIISLGVGVAVAVSGHHFINYLIALVSLGIGWNFLFVSGTMMLTHSYYPRERFKVQGVNDFTVFTFGALATLSAGSVLATTNWEMLNLLSVPLLLLTLVLVLTTRLKKPGQAP